MTDTGAPVLDVAIIGSGISGVIFLKYARASGLDCLVLEKQNRVGGLWTSLPAWQDIQNRRQDFAINDVPLDGVHQPDIARHVEEWILRYDLAPFIRLNTEVQAIRRREGLWQVETPQQTFAARFVVAATGAQNRPFQPTVARHDCTIVERHSSALTRPQSLAGRRVTVVGGGASSWDLLDMAIEHGASEVHWVSRRTKWFLPTKKAKQEARPNLRTLAVIQAIIGSARIVSLLLRLLLAYKYARHGVTALKPAEPFDLKKHQLIPGRATMLSQLDRVQRHRSRIARLSGRSVVLENGEAFETDVLLWGTGYRIHFRYLDLPEYQDIETVNQLLPRLGSLVRSMDYPNLFFIGMSLTESTSATPFFAAFESKSIVSHIRGRCEIPDRIVSHQVAHWHLLRHFAGFDHQNYPRLWWRVRSLLRAFFYALFANKRIRL